MRRFPGSALALALLVLVLLTRSSAAEGVDRDRLAPVNPEAAGFAAFPPGVLSQTDAETVARVVQEARQFGVPFSIRIVAVPTSLAPIGMEALPEQVTQRMADEWLAEEPFASSDGADDGILLLVVIPRDDLTQTTAAFATGEHALPQNGLTRARLDAIVRDVMAPRIANNRIGAALTQGTAMVSYVNLFLPSPRLPLTENQEALQRFTNQPLALLVIAGAAGVLGVLLWIRTRARHAPAAAASELSPYAAGAIARGRVDDAVTTGALLRLIELDALTPRATGSGATLLIGADPENLGPFEREVWEIVRRQATGDPPALPPGAMRWLPRLLDPVRDTLRDDLARRGLLNRSAQVEHAWLLLACGGALALALYAAIPSIIGMARWGIGAIVLTVIVVALTLWWAWRRSWATPAGEQALAAWLAAHPDPATADRALYEAIIDQDALLRPPGGSASTPAPVRLVRALRGLGTA